ncbi:MAG: 6,7-dimethyl-8-ribityllumazine synthase [Caulobacteraceae bacterium]|nr:6,7-dimethyl-8-ribityllumazine synthase [Caulobacteraceae bacterium]
MLHDKFRLLVVESRVHEDMADALLQGAQAAIAAADAECDLVTSPSALEIPGLIAIAEEGGHRPAGVRYDGYVALGCVIRDETYQFNVIAHEVARGLMDLQIGRRLAIGWGLLNVERADQAWARIKGADGRGAAAARACLTMITTKRRLMGAIR